jgi:hypothetical protein
VFHHRQSGTSFVYILLFILLGGVVLLTVQMFPIIYDAQSLKKVFAEMEDEDQFRDGTSKIEIEKYIDRILQVNQIRYLRPKDAEITKDYKRKRFVVNLNYDYPIEIIKTPAEKNDGTMDVTLVLSFRNEAILKMK